MVIYHSLEDPVTLRRLIVIPVLAAALGCGPCHLTRREAENDIRKDYPVVVSVKVPESAKAIKGSSEHAQLVSLQEALARSGWFAVTRSSEGDREQFQFKLKASAPKSIRAGANGYELPAAEAEFVRGPAPAGHHPGRGPRHLPDPPGPPHRALPDLPGPAPGVRVGETKERHASYRRQGRSWIMMDTDESFKKAQ